MCGSHTVTYFQACEREEEDASSPAMAGSVAAEQRPHGLFKDLQRTHEELLLIRQKVLHGKLHSHCAYSMKVCQDVQQVYRISDSVVVQVGHLLRANEDLQFEAMEAKEEVKH